MTHAFSYAVLLLCHSLSLSPSEYAVSGASVAQGWSNHLSALLNLMGLSLPKAISSAPWALHEETGDLYATGAILDLPALLITLAITLLLVRGVKESTRFASIMVLLKVAVVLFVIVVGAFFVSTENYEPVREGREKERAEKSKREAAEILENGCCCCCC
jgi:amino acid transporter